MSIFIRVLLIITAFLIIGGIIEGYIDHRNNKKVGRVTHTIYEDSIKRALDWMCGMAALIVFWPLYLVVAILVRIKHGTPVLFTQKRPGRDEKIFKIYKFRTMTNAVDEDGNLLPDEDRLTKFGIFLRSTSLDELPETFNIIKGDMSVVGPRPLLTEYLDRYTDEQKRRHIVRPGLSGLAMSTIRNSAGWKAKFDLDIKYVDNVSFWLDLKIVFKTIIIAIKREGINEDGFATNSIFQGEGEE